MKQAKGYVILMIGIIPYFLFMTVFIIVGFLFEAIYGGFIIGRYWAEKFEEYVTDFKDRIS